jgi:hypothetical protein
MQTHQQVQYPGSESFNSSAAPPQEYSTAYISENQPTTTWASSDVLTTVHSIPMPPVPRHFPAELFKDEPLLHHHYTWHQQQ